MRITCRKDDPGIYTVNFDGNVLLNGEDVVNDCITADDKSGYILRYKRNSRGEIIINRSMKCGETEELYGEVKIISR